MLEWLFEPLFKTQTCVGEINNTVCHTEMFGLSPIIIIVIGTFMGCLSLSSMINDRKEKKKLKSETDDVL